MKQQARTLARRVAAKVTPTRLERRRAATAAAPTKPAAANDPLRRRVAALEREVQELRQLNRRLADTIDVVTELLVPAMDRDDALVKKALERLG